MTADFSKHDTAKRKWLMTGVAATLVIVLLIPFAWFRVTMQMTPDKVSATDMSLTFVGREKCKECHRNEYEKWENSHHDRAMDLATDKTVLGDFSNVTFTHENVTFRFFKKGDDYFVNSKGPEGEYKDFQITHTFGFSPLQQYLIPFEGGRLQCLTIAWDDDKKSWYALPNHTNDYKDWLHWTKQGQNWNGMCAECHSTNLRKGYNHKENSFNTTWSEIDVSCEACHGPGSAHVAWANIPEMGRLRTDNYKLVVKTRDISSHQLIEVCARCHSRRTSLDDFSHDHKQIMDYMLPSLLTETLYYPDGQIYDEVYVYGSFMQSKMFMRNVKCSDCHDVHSQKLKLDGNDLCLSCHKKDVYDTKDHHFHKKVHEGNESRGDDCIECHMPQRPYMGIDMRADHSIRIPRPDLSNFYQTPNACNAAGCHSDKTLAWTNEHMKKWYGEKTRAHYGEIIAKGRQGDSKALMDLIRLSKDMLFPEIVRATAVSVLSRYPVQPAYNALEKSLSDPAPLVRQTAIATINLLRFDKDAALIFPLIYDPVKAVRIQAALGVASLKNLQLSAAQKKILDKGINEYITAMQYVADFPSGRYNLGLIYQAKGDVKKAVENYEQALKIDGLFVPAQNNLAMLYNEIGENDKAVALFKQILENRPDMAEISYSLGLLLAERKKYIDAVIYLKRAAGGMPERARVHYNLGLLLQHLKQDGQAERSLLKALSLNPGSFDFLYAMADHYMKRKMFDEASLVAQKMTELFPKNQVGYKIMAYADAMKQRKNKDGVPQISKIFTTKTGKAITVTETHPVGQSLSTIQVSTKGFAHEFNETFADKDPIVNAVMADLDENGYEELYLFLRSSGSGSYGSVMGFASNNDKSISIIYFPELNPMDKRFEGYMGHDLFEIKENRMEQTFPVYRKGDSNARPTGGKRKLIYRLSPGEAGWRLDIEASEKN